ncbi:MAG: sigma-70 family RNA polymerase sigma factor [Pseudomonadota bacterium]
MKQPPTEVTRLLQQWRVGDDAALGRLTPLVYEELRRVAQHFMRSENAAHTLQPTALINEAYLRMVGADVDWQDRVHFFSMAARIMRRILVDHARAKGSAKRGGDQLQVSIDDRTLAAGDRDQTLIALDDSLEDLAHFDARKANIIELFFFGGLGYEEIGEVLEISRATVYRELSLAKAWLYNDLANDTP